MTFASQTALGAAVTAVGKTVDGEKGLISDQLSSVIKLFFKVLAKAG